MKCEKIDVNRIPTEPCSSWKMLGMKNRQTEKNTTPAHSMEISKLINYACLSCLKFSSIAKDELWKLKLAPNEFNEKQWTLIMILTTSITWSRTTKFVINATNEEHGSLESFESNLSGCVENGCGEKNNFNTQSM